MTVLKHPVVVIAGPTASGKSGLALDLAEAQGEAVQEMMELSSPSFHVLDVYA